MKYVLSFMCLLAVYVDADGITSSRPEVAPVFNTSSYPEPSAPSQTDSLKIRLRDVPSLKFEASQFATRRRTASTPQLNCISGCHGVLPTSGRCENAGVNHVGSVIWKCELVIQRGKKLERSRVRCEAFTEGDKEYVLEGSCILDYALGVTNHSISSGSH